MAMMRIFALCCLFSAPFSATCHAQEWAAKMFETKNYDFGTVARASKAEYAFELTNLYVEDVHIASVRASCGCTTPRIEKDTLRTYEKSAIIAHINSDSFLGHQGATLTVTIDKPYYAQVQLHVKVYVYKDVLLEPSIVGFGNVGQGKPVARTISVRYKGRSDWQILEVKSGNPHLSGAVTETMREEGRVAYDLNVVMDENAPIGYLREYVRLVTNDPNTKQILVPVEGQVQPNLSASPSSLFLGVVQPGESVTKNIVVRGQKPLKIVSIRTDCECLQPAAPADSDPKSFHLIPVTFTAGKKTGELAQTILIETDSSKTALTVSAFAVVGEK